MKKLLIVLALGAAGAAVWFAVRPRGEAAAEEQKPVAQVQVAPLRTAKIVDALQAFGVIEPAPSGAQGVALGFDAVVTRVAVSPGATVAKGDLLLEVQGTPDSKLAVVAARSAAKLAEQGLQSARQKFELKLATSQDLLVAQQADDDARARLASIESRGQSGDGRILAAGPGIISKVDAQVGLYVPAGTSLLTVASASLLEAHLGVEPTDASRVRAGQPVSLSAPGRPDAGEVAGTVRQVGAALDPGSGAVDVRVSIPAGGGWFAGEHVRASIHVGEKTALLAPRAAVLPDDAQQVIFTVKDGKASKHPVQVGIAAEQEVEISGKGLAPGDLAVVVGNYELEDGMAVAAAAPSDAKPDTEKSP